MGMTPRSGESAYVNDERDAMGAERGDECVDRVGGMADGPNRHMRPGSLPEFETGLTNAIEGVEAKNIDLW